jgi:uncharacterized membrane protein YhfC
LSASLAAMFAQAGLMIVLPLVLWSRVTRRLGLGRHGWAAIGYGCLFFILSQIVQAPFRIGANAAGLTVGLAGAWVFALLSGVGEESMRYVAMRWVAQIRERLDRATAISYGLGHGGFESLALGLGVLATAFLIRNALADSAAASLPDGLAAQARIVAETPPLQFFGGVLERLLAMTLHVGLSLIVARAVVRGSVGLLGLAMAWHAAANGVALTLQTTLQNGLLTEAWVAVAAGAALYYGLRTPDAEGSTATS